MIHLNQTICEKCISIINTYPNPHPLIVTFVDKFRAANPDAHISACGRSQADQDADFAKGVSRAKWGQSAHNYNAAVDFFRLTLAQGASFDANWYKTVLGPAIKQNPNLVWGGTFTSIVDLPHCEVAGWAQEAQNGQLKLVQG